MNTKIALTTFCVILSFHSIFAQELENIDLERMEIEGKVTSLKESKHKPLEEGDAWEPNPYRSEIISFNKEGYIDELERLEPAMLSGCRDAVAGAERDLDFLRLADAPFRAVPGRSIDFQCWCNGGWSSLGKIRVPR